MWADQHYRDKITKIKRVDTKKLWADPVYRERQTKCILKARKQRPTGAETKLYQLLQHLCHGEFQYNGSSADVVLAGHVPDFVNVNGKKQIIELFGCYWHGCRLCGHRAVVKNRNDQQRLNDFRKLGWHPLVVWEHELGTTKLETKVNNFINA